MPDQTDWVDTRDAIVSEIMNLPNVSGGKINIGTATSLALTVRSTKEVYEKQVEPVLEKYRGVVRKWERIGRESLGAEYLYTLVFTRNPDAAYTLDLDFLEGK